MLSVGYRLGKIQFFPAGIRRAASMKIGLASLVIGYNDATARL